MPKGLNNGQLASKVRVKRTTTSRLKGVTTSQLIVSHKL